MGFATTKKKPLQSTPRSTPAAHPGDVLDEETTATGFFGHICKQVGRKPFYLGLHLSKTWIDKWCSGDKRDVFTEAKEACDIVRKERRADLIPAILQYIAGEFDGAVLTPEEAGALRQISKALERG